jgi:hypothetical protein
VGGGAEVGAEIRAVWLWMRGTVVKRHRRRAGRQPEDVPPASSSVASGSVAVEPLQLLQRAGGGRRCQHEGCVKAAVTDGTLHCVAHGGGRRCASTRAAPSRLKAARITA